MAEKIKNKENYIIEEIIDKNNKNENNSKKIFILQKKVEDLYFDYFEKYQDFDENDFVIKEQYEKMLKKIKKIPNLKFRLENLEKDINLINKVIYKN